MTQSNRLRILPNAAVAATIGVVGIAWSCHRSESPSPVTAECRGPHYAPASFQPKPLACALGGGSPANRVAADRVFQIVGESDLGASPVTPTRNRTGSSVDLLGADLGFSVAHHGKLLFLFADGMASNPDDPLRPRDADVVGFTSDVSGSGADSGFDLDFYRDVDGKYLALRVDDHFLCRNDGPSSAFSDGETLYGLFNVGEQTGEIDAHTGVATKYGFLAASNDDGRTFHRLFELPGTRNQYVQPMVVDTSTVPGVDWPSAKTVLMWMRRDDTAPVLVAAPLDRITDPTSFRWWANGTTPNDATWVASEDEARRVYCPGAEHCFGNFGVALLPGANQWLMTMRCQSPDGAPWDSFVGYRLARSPLGPWSDMGKLYDAADDGGYCHFIHRSCSGADCCDHDYLPYDGDFGPDQMGRVYGPFVVREWSRWNEATRTSTFFAVMSTSNPYTNVLMRFGLVVPN